MWVDDWLTTRPAIQIGMDHLSHDWPRANDRDLDHKVVEGLRLESGERGHLRAAFDLENADGVRATHHGVGFGIVGGELR